MWDDSTWLERWLPLIRERAAGRPVLELGCGSGRDTAVLVAAGLGVIAVDRSADAIGRAKARVPSAVFHCQDIRAPFPADAAQSNVVLASLSLHYFSWFETQRLVRKIADTARSGGLLVCRVNATDDQNFGAAGHPEIEPHFYSVDGQPKRFFDESALDVLFAGWNVVSREHQIIDRYEAPKAVWEVVAGRR